MTKDTGLTQGFPVKHVANCFLEWDFRDNCPTITPLKLQKLVYCLHGWHLAITGLPAIDRHFEAWPYGPVEEDLYHIFKNYGNQPISDYAKSWEGDTETAYMVLLDDNRKFGDILDFTILRYMPLSALELSTLTHQPGTPWAITKEKGEAVIDNDLIRDHFRELVN